MNDLKYRRPVKGSMRGKNVALRREAVEILDREKRHGESYSDVVVRLAAGRPSLSALADYLEALPPVKDGELTRRVRSIRRQSRRGWAGRAPR